MIPGKFGRKPEERPRGRLDTLAVVPAFFRLKGRRAVVIGGTAAAAWKAELLSAAGAQVDVYAPEPCPDMAALTESPVEGPVTVHTRPWEPNDLVGAAIAVADVEHGGEASAFRAAAKMAGVPANAVDKPAHSDFQFGAIVNRSPLVIGISTDGAAPVLGQTIRGRIEMLLPQSFRRWVEAAQSWRPAVQARKLPFRLRRLFWERFTARALAAPTKLPDAAERQVLFDALDRDSWAEQGGSVALVGAGPGDPELLTVKALRYLQSAEAILYDDLIQPGVLDFARREARLIHVGKRGHKPSCTQEDINGLLISLARDGLKIVRLKGGDPTIFGRAGEEIAALEAAGIAVEVVPGVTAASGAAASLNVSLTHRDMARRLQFVTCHAKNGELPDDLDWAALADPAATTAIYMGVKTLPAFVERARVAGLSPGTPVAVVERATWADERLIAGTLDTIVALMAKAAPRGPCIALVGEAMRKTLRVVDEAAGVLTTTGQDCTLPSLSHLPVAQKRLHLAAPGRAEAAAETRALDSRNG
jgi:uroporphyrin-III C-methyltransferase/precorrin-2 dehydrogenase/sirohydrochlorin ferrochelatase